MYKNTQHHICADHGFSESELPQQAYIQTFLFFSVKEREWPLHRVSSPWPPSVNTMCGSSKGYHVLYFAPINLAVVQPTQFEWFSEEVWDIRSASSWFLFQSQVSGLVVSLTSLAHLKSFWCVYQFSHMTASVWTAALLWTDACDNWRVLTVSCLGSFLLTFVSHSKMDAYFPSFSPSSSAVFFCLVGCLVWFGFCLWDRVLLRRPDWPGSHRHPLLYLWKDKGVDHHIPLTLIFYLFIWFFWAIYLVIVC